MLSRAEHAYADERVEHDGDLHLAAAHVADIGRLIDDLRPRFECEAARADGDDRVEPGNRGADSHAAEAEFCDRGAQNSRIEFIMQRLYEFGVEEATETRSADDDDAVIFSHEIADRLDFRLSKGDFRHDAGSSDQVERLSLRPDVGQRRLGRGKRALIGKLDDLLDLLPDCLVEPLELLSLDEADDHKFACHAQYRIIAPKPRFQVRILLRNFTVPSVPYVGDAGHERRPLAPRPGDGADLDEGGAAPAHGPLPGVLGNTPDRAEVHSVHAGGGKA